MHKALSLTFFLLFSLVFQCSASSTQETKTIFFENAGYSITVPAWVPDFSKWYGSVVSKRVEGSQRILIFWRASNPQDSSQTVFALSIVDLNSETPWKIFHIGVEDRQRTRHCTDLQFLSTSRQSFFFTETKDFPPYESVLNLLLSFLPCVSL